MSTAEGFVLHLRHAIVVDRPIDAAMHDQSRTGLASLAALLEREIPEPGP